jgi:hypothetical protein
MSHALPFFCVLLNRLVSSVIRVRISLTYRAVPYCVELEGSDRADVNFFC